MPHAFFYRLLCLVLLVASSTRAELTPPECAALEKQLQIQTAALSERLLCVGRLGLIDTRPALPLNDSGLLLTSYLKPIDERDTPYIVYTRSGDRIPVRPLLEDNKTQLVLLQLKPGQLAATPAIPIAPASSLETCSWCLTASFAPVPAHASALQIHLSPLLSTPREKSPRFDLAIRTASPGHPVFDLAGRLVAIGTRIDMETGTSSCISIDELREKNPEFATHLPPVTTADLPELTYLLRPSGETEEGARPANPARDALETLARANHSNLAVVAIHNEESTPFTGIQGVILKANGLILSKASDLGSNPVCWHEGTAYPAVLLATDTATDLALLDIEASGLPTLKWAKASPRPGSLASSPLLIATPPYYPDTAVGIIYATSPADPTRPNSLHSPEHITSLGILLEQGESSLRIAALFPGGPAATAGLKRQDLLTHLDGHAVSNRTQLTKALGRHTVGDQLQLTVQRQSKATALSLELGAARVSPPLATLSTTEIHTFPSVYRSGFADTWTHDLPLEAWNCGSPLLDMDGQVIGLNIANTASGRVLALPSATVQAAIQRMLARSIDF